MENDEIIWYIRRNPGFTATQLAKVFGKKVVSLSSFLTKKVNAGVLVRKEGVGPRGGYGYYWPGETPRNDRSGDKTLWQHLMEAD